MRIASTSSVAEQDALARRAAGGDVDAERVWIESHRAGVATWATRLGLDPTWELVDSALEALAASARNGFDFSRGYVLGLWAFADVHRALETFAAHDARCAAAARAGELEATARARGAQGDLRRRARTTRGGGGDRGAGHPRRRDVGARGALPFAVKCGRRRWRNQTAKSDALTC